MERRIDDIPGGEGVFRQDSLIKAKPEYRMCSGIHSMKFLHRSMEHAQGTYRRVDTFYCQYCLYHVTAEYTYSGAYRPWWYTKDDR